MPSNETQTELMRIIDKPNDVYESIISKLVTAHQIHPELTKNEIEEVIERMITPLKVLEGQGDIKILKLFLSKNSNLELCQKVSDRIMEHMMSRWNKNLDFSVLADDLDLLSKLGLSTKKSIVTQLYSLMEKFNIQNLSPLEAHSGEKSIASVYDFVRRYLDGAMLRETISSTVFTSESVVVLKVLNDFHSITGNPEVGKCIQSLMDQMIAEAHMHYSDRPGYNAYTEYLPGTEEVDIERAYNFYTSVNGGVVNIQKILSIFESVGEKDALHYWGNTDIGYYLVGSFIQIIRQRWESFKFDPEPCYLEELLFLMRNGLGASLIKKLLNLEVSSLERYCTTTLLNTFYLSDEPFRSEMIDIFVSINKAPRQDPEVFRFILNEIKNDKDLVVEAVKENIDIFQFLSDEMKNDKNFLIAAVKQNPYVFPLLLDEMKNDKYFVIEVVKKNIDVFQFLSDEMKNDKEVVRAAVDNDLDVFRFLSPEAFNYLSDEMKNDKDAATTALKLNPLGFKFFSDTIQNNKALLLSALRRDLSVFQQFSNKMKNDKNFLIAAVKQNPSVFPLLSDEMKNDKYFVVEVVKKNIDVFQFLSDEMKNDIEVVRAAVDNDLDVFRFLSPEAFNCLSDEMKNDKDAAMTVLKLNPEGFKFFSETLQNDQALLLPALRRDLSVFQHFSNKMKNDKTFLIAAVKMNTEVLQFVSNKMENYIDLVITTATKNPDALALLSNELKDDITLAYAVVDKLPDGFQHFSNQIKNNKDLVLFAIRMHRDVYNHLSYEMQKDTEVICAVFSSNQNKVDFLSNKLKNDKKLAYAVVDKQPNAFKLFSDMIQNDKELVRVLVMNDPIVFQSLSNEMKNNKEVVLAAVSADPKVYRFLSVNMKKDPQLISLLMRLMENKPSLVQDMPIVLNYNQLIRLSKVAPDSFVNYVANNQCYSPSELTPKERKRVEKRYEGFKNPQSHGLSVFGVLRAAMTRHHQPKLDSSSKKEPCSNGL